MTETGRETVGDVIRYLAPELLSVEPGWPPDAFAIAAVLLKRSGAYREVANAWPPAGYADTSSWHKSITTIANQWRKVCDSNTAAMPAQVKLWWDEVLGHLTFPVARIAEDEHLFVALVGIVAAADRACGGFGFLDKARTISPKEDRANTNLSTLKSLCEFVHPSKCTVLPKAHNPYTGMTLRSLTHNLALWDRSEVSATWENIKIDIPNKAMNVLLVPWPMIIAPDSFHPAHDCHDLHLPSRVGLFEYDLQFADTDVGRVAKLIEQAKSLAGEIHAVIFPELTMSETQFAKLQRRVQGGLGIPLLVSGIGGSHTDKLGTNDVAISVHRHQKPYLQSKHHRWRIDHVQAKSYGLSLLPRKKEHGAWWEAIHIEDRSCRFFNANDWLTFCVLICEDLARQDPVSELVRSVGPSLVVALLLDAAQVRTRWPDRYATVLAEDPRSSVLTLTAAGLVDLANDKRGGGDRSIALWREAFQSQSRPIILEPGAKGVVLTLQSKMAKEWTADGRHDDAGTGYLTLPEAGIIQVK